MRDEDIVKLVENCIKNIKNAQVALEESHTEIYAFLEEVENARKLR